MWWAGHLVGEDDDAHDGEDGDGTRISIVQYNDDGQTHFTFSGDKSEILDNIDDMTYLGGDDHNTGKAIDHAYDDVIEPDARENSSVIVIVITDDKSDDDPIVPTNNLKDNGIEVYVIGIGNTTDPDELNNMSTDPDHVIVVDTTDDLDSDDLTQQTQTVVNELWSRKWKANMRHAFEGTGCRTL